ncbi:MAG TPA: ABC transporter permease [Tepidisphaeraceae bacterium]|nr:ABC transporter permease [Tepidisphaeraceae bacterium]
MIQFFAKLTHGHFRRHRLEALLCLLGVALGVAVVIAIDSAVAACVRSFSGAVSTLAERSTHSIFAEGGTIADQAYMDLLKRKLPYPLAPVIDRGVLIDRPSPTPVSEGTPEDPGSAARKDPGLRSTSDTGVGGSSTFARLIGVDVFSERALRSFTKMQSTLDDAAFRTFLTEPGQVVLVDALAKRLNVAPGSTLRITSGARRSLVHVVGVVQPTGIARSQINDLVIADLATAQELTGLIGQIDRIDTVLDNDQQVSALTSQLPSGLILRSTRQQSQSLAQLIQSYRLNLNALSLMASFVAVFIVYNSMLISVQQRARSLGILRCLGAARPQLAGLYASEAVAFALLGGAIGVPGGWLLARILVGYVSTTINDLYAAINPGPVQLDAAMWAKGLAVSLCSCIVGALVPLVQASRMPPINAFRASEHQRASRWMPVRLLAIGAILLAITYGVYLIPTDSPLVGFVMALLAAFGFALVCPWFTRIGCRAIDAAARPAQLLPLQMATAGVARSLGITGVAVAATMLAMAMNVGIRTMVSSFRGSLSDWFGHRFAADIFVGPELLLNHHVDATIDPRVEQWVRAQPEAKSVVTNRSREVPLGGKSTLLFATDVADTLKTLPMKSVDRGRPFDPKTDALISEPLAGRIKRSTGDTFTVSAPTGPQTFRVYGVFYDFGTERGQFMIDRRTYAAAWRDDALTSLHVTIAPGVDRTALAGRWSAELRQQFPVVVNSFDSVKTEAMTVFDRTFKVTEVLTWLGGGVAFCGLAGSLLALALARQRDYSILAAVGMSGRQTAAWVLGQGIVIAWASALIAPVAGTVLAYILAYVIQYRSFGWSIPTHAQPMFWVQNFLIATSAALVAAVYPIYRLRAAPPAASLRPE